MVTKIAIKQVFSKQLQKGDYSLSLYAKNELSASFLKIVKTFRKASALEEVELGLQHWVESPSLGLLAQLPEKCTASICETNFSLSSFKQNLASVQGAKLHVNLLMSTMDDKFLWHIPSTQTDLLISLSLTLSDCENFDLMLLGEFLRACKRLRQLFVFGDVALDDEYLFVCKGEEYVFLFFQFLWCSETLEKMVFQALLSYAGQHLLDPRGEFKHQLELLPRCSSHLRLFSADFVLSVKQRYGYRYKFAEERRRLIMHDLV